MILKPGTVVGSFEILAPLGAGGMGEVWRARDNKLQRVVAIKTLSAGFASDPERLSRFQREAQTLASLNHPNIAVIYDLFQDGPTRLLVLELVEGETLAERVRRGPIPVEEAVAIAKQVASALEAAHEKGIVHRDLKPANIKITPEGVVKVLDFGLAKVTGPDAESTVLSHSPTVLTGTADGIILGTPGYLSPEQARGKTVDKRTDIWAFGCVLYEMLSGRQTFTGETVSDVMAAILTRDADLQSLRDVPGKVQELIARCLQKDPMRRLRDIGDARILLEEALAPQVDAQPKLARSASARQPKLVWVLALFAAFSAGIGVTWFANSRNISGGTWSGVKLGGPEIALLPRVQPNGTLIAFQAMVAGVNQVAVMQMESGDWKVLTQERSQGYIDCALSWGNDARIYYGRVFGVPRGVFSIPAVGGEERLVVEDADCPEVLPDGSLLVIQLNDTGQAQIYRHWPGTDRQRREYPGISPYTSAANFRAFRDGKEAVFWGKLTKQPESDPCYHLYALDLGSGSARQVETDARFPCDEKDVTLSVGADDNTILIAVPRANLRALMQIPRRGGTARELTSMSTEIWGFDVASNGDLYVDQISRPMEILMLAPDGTHPQTILTSGAYVDVPELVMPDGRVLFTSDTGGLRRVLAVKPGQNPTPFLQGTEETSGPVAMVGMSEVAFLIGPAATRQLAVASDDGRNVRRLEKADGRTISTLAASPDGKTLYYAAGGSYYSGASIWAIDSRGGEPRRIQGGSSVAVDPQGNLIIQIVEKDTVRLERVPHSGGQAQPLSFPDLRLAPMPFTSNAVRADGAIIKNISTPDSWLWSPVILFPETGKGQRIPLSSFLDVHHASWAPDGGIVLFTLQTHGALWRLRPTSSGTE